MGKSVKDIHGDMSNKINKGNFDCSHNPKLDSLEGAPKSVGGNFNCSWNPKLESLKGAPETVKGNFDCGFNNKLDSLKYAPKSVGGNFYCGYCPKLDSLDELIYNETVIQGDIICDKKLQKEADDYNKNLRLYKKLGKKKYKSMKELMDAINA